MVFPSFSGQGEELCALVCDSAGQIESYELFHLFFFVFSLRDFIVLHCLASLYPHFQSPTVFHQVNEADQCLRFYIQQLRESRTPLCQPKLPQPRFPLSFPMFSLGILLYLLTLQLPEDSWVVFTVATSTNLYVPYSSHLPTASLWFHTLTSA